MDQYKQAWNSAHSWLLSYLADGTRGPMALPVLTQDSSWDMDLFSLRKMVAKHLPPARVTGQGGGGRQ